jgi:hypothetical protein
MVSNIKNLYKCLGLSFNEINELAILETLIMHAITEYLEQKII